MNPLFELLTQHWLSTGVITLALILMGLGGLVRWARRPLLILAGLLAALAAGDLAGLDRFWSYTIFISASSVLLVLILLLVFAGLWWPLAAWTSLILALFGGGAVTFPGLARGLDEMGRALASVEIVHPWWLLLLLLIPLLSGLAAGSLGLGNLTPEQRRWFWRYILTTLFILPPVGLALLIGFMVRNRRRFRADSWRPWISLDLRCLLVLFLTLALAEPRLNQLNENTTVLFVLDRSLSIPEEVIEDPKHKDVRIDQRAKRILDFINGAVQRRGKGHERDKAGLVVFGRRARLELPPADAPRFNLHDLPPAPDGNYTDIAGALKLAMASFPEGTGKRLVLISDGNENLGNAEEQARLAKSLGIQIDVLPLAAGQRNEDEVLVERVEAPPLTEQGNKVPIRVLVRSYNPHIVVARLVLRQITEDVKEARLKVGPDGGIGIDVEAAVENKAVRIKRVLPGSPADVTGLKTGDEITRFNERPMTNPAQFGQALAGVKPGEQLVLTIRRDPVRVVGDVIVRLTRGLNPPFTFTRPLTDEQRSYTYEAEIMPLRIVDAEGNVLHEGRPRGDRVQNNRASAHVVARGQRRILLLENRPAGAERQLVHTFLIDKLLAAGDKKFKVDAGSVAVLNNYPDRDNLMRFLSNYDCVILANVPADLVSEEQREALRTNTQDQGCGLIMVGGPESFGAGGWQNTAVEKALPVDCDIKALKVQGKGGLVMVMHASEMADGNFWQKQIAKLAIDRLGPSDEVGVIDFDFQSKWVIKLQEVGFKRDGLKAQIDKMMPGDMPDFDPTLQMANDALMDPKKELATKHIIIISDGDPQYTPALIQKLKQNKITVTTVGVACHGAQEDQKMAAIAKMTGGRTYSVKNPNQLPAIYIKESRMVSQSFVHERVFSPLVRFRSGPTDRLPEPPPLRGYVRTTPKANALVEIPIMTPHFNEQEFPILAYWHYGLGKSVAFTSDAGDPRFWSRGWAEGADGKEAIYAKFWEQVVEWSLRPTESNQLAMVTEHRDGKIRITVEDLTEDKKVSRLQVSGGVSGPGGGDRRQTLVFVPKASRLYEAEIKAEEAGSYFITAQATRTVKVKGPDGKDKEVEEKDSVRAGITLPYSPEFADMESNTALLERMRELTGGRAYQDNAGAIEEAIATGAVFRPGLPRMQSLLPLWYWLVVWTSVLLVIDVAVRRVRVDAAEAQAAMIRYWAMLRGQPVPEPGRDEYMDRLKAKKTQVGDTLAQRRTRRFETDTLDVSAPPLLGDAGHAPAASSGPRPTAPKPESVGPGEPDTEEGDFASRLQRAKKQVWDQRHKDKDKQD